MDKLTMLYLRMTALLTPLKDKKGQGMVEYALLLTLIALVIIAVITMVGGTLNNKYSGIGTSMP